MKRIERESKRKERKGGRGKKGRRKGKGRGRELVELLWGLSDCGLCLCLSREACPGCSGPTHPRDFQSLLSLSICLSK